MAAWAALAVWGCLGLDGVVSGCLGLFWAAWVAGAALWASTPTCWPAPRHFARLLQCACCTAAAVHVACLEKSLGREAKEYQGDDGKDWLCCEVGDRVSGLKLHKLPLASRIGTQLSALAALSTGSRCAYCRPLALTFACHATRRQRAHTAQQSVLRSSQAPACAPVRMSAHSWVLAAGVREGGRLTCTGAGSSA